MLKKRRRKKKRKKKRGGGGGGELENLLLEKSGRVKSDMLVTFYNAVICSIIMFGSVRWVGNISKFDRRLENVIEQDMGWESHWTFFRLLWNATVQQTKANIKPILQTQWDTALTEKRSNKSGRFLIPKTNTNRYKALFLYPLLCWFWMKIMTWL